MVSGRVNAQLAQIATQIRSLQAQAREVLEAAREDMQLHRAKCNFRRIPGKVYHLYRHSNGELHFSMLSPDDWKGRPPHQFVGSYRRESDLSWVPAAPTWGYSAVISSGSKPTLLLPEELSKSRRELTSE